MAGGRPLLPGERQILPGSLPAINHTGGVYGHGVPPAKGAIMRIYGPAGTAAATTAAPARRAPAGGFSVSEGETPHAAPAAAGLRSVAGIDALIALQGVEDPTERRRHAVKRGRLALDVLDELKIGLLGGDLSQVTLGKLRSAAAVLRDRSGEPELDSVLGEIELRVEVEIAKMEPR